MTFFNAFLFIASLATTGLHAVRVGDSHHGDVLEGNFWALCDNEVKVIDPVQKEIVKVINVEDYVDYFDGWGDAVYQRDQAQIRHYLFANVKTTSDIPNGYVMVFDTYKNEWVSTVDVGDRPIHMYSIESREEIWTHPDGDGHFDILHMSDIEHLSHSALKAHDELPGHGKLLFDPELQNKAYATNTAEGLIYELSLEYKEEDIIPVEMTLPTGESCVGTHGIAYMHLNQHLYIQCSGVGSDDTCDPALCDSATWEVDARTNTPLFRFPNVLGQTYGTPNEDYVIATNGDDGMVHVMIPKIDDENGDPVQAEVFDVQLDAGAKPGKVAFFEYDPALKYGEGDLEDYKVYISDESDAADSGLWVLDLHSAIDVSDNVPTPEFYKIELGEGKKYRPISRGGHFVATPVFDAASGQEDAKIAIVDTRTDEKIGDFACRDASRVVWAPLHSDELSYKIGLNEQEISALQNEVDDLQYLKDEVDDLAYAGFALALIALILTGVTIFLVLTRTRSGGYETNNDDGPYKATV